MKSTPFQTFAPPPEREELRDVPLSPRLIVEISRLLRSRLLREESGVMAQGTARLVMSLLATRGTLGQQELVQYTRLKPPSVSVLLRRMQEEGYVERVICEQDRRAVRVTLTEKGRAFDREHLCRLSTNDHQAMRGLTAEEQKTLEALLLRVRENLKEGQDAKPF